jgi:hypothetical protein
MQPSDTPIYDQLLAEQGPLAVMFTGFGALEKFSASLRELGRQFSRAVVIPIGYEMETPYFEPSSADAIYWKHTPEETP